MLLLEAFALAPSFSIISVAKRVCFAYILCAYLVSKLLIYLVTLWIHLVTLRLVTLLVFMVLETFALTLSCSQSTYKRNCIKQFLKSLFCCHSDNYSSIHKILGFFPKMKKLRSGNTIIYTHPFSYLLINPAASQSYINAVHFFLLCIGKNM